MLVRVGGAFTTLDNIIKVERVDPLLARKRIDSWSTVEPVWVMHKPSQGPNDDIDDDDDDFYR